MGFGSYGGPYNVGTCGNPCYRAGYRGGNTFALIVVLFILLIIVGATFYR